uniref:Ig-like domain-containing protein n=1 Tax=Leptobrachium leishanense TaxID=445787 RepID=A0A8C5Q8D8_9ANUR
MYQLEVPSWKLTVSVLYKSMCISACEQVFSLFTESITDIVVKSHTSEIKENDTVTLTCETKNANRIVWVRVSGSLPSDRYQSNARRTITFPSIKRSAAGDYYCEAENLASKKRSNIYTLTVNLFLSVWMERVSAISIQLIPPYPAVGQSVTLSVTGINGNIRQIMWYKGSNTDASNNILIYIPSANQPQINGLQYFSRASALPNASLLISDLEFTDGDNYTVTVQTLQPAQQTSVKLTVYEFVTDPVVKSNISIKENDPVTLTCETENAARIVWGRVSGILPSDTIVSKDNTTITFPSIKRSAAGDYYCEAENPVSKKKSNIYTLTVNSCSTAAMAGIICGTILIIVLIISVTFLLYKRYIIPLKENKQGCAKCAQDTSRVYDNILNSAEGLQFRHQDGYGELKR